MSSQISRLAEAGLTRCGFIQVAGLAGAMKGLPKTLARAEGMIGLGHVIATDSSFAFRARGADRVAVVLGGDGSYATPHFHSAPDNARLLDLPFIYVLEDNPCHRYAPYSYARLHRDIADAARADWIPARVVDGPDVFQVFNVAPKAVDRARADDGPSFTEVKTYRYCNHWGAPGGEVSKRGARGYDLLAITLFRPEREVRAWMQRDLVYITRKTLIDWGVLDVAAADAIGQEVRAEVAEAFARAAGQPLCSPEDGLKHVFAEGEVPPRQIARPQEDAMTVETWMSCVRETVAAEMRADPAMIRIYDLTPPVASNASMPLINPEVEFGRRRVVKTGLGENWMASAAPGTGLAGSRAASYIPYQGAGMPFQVIQNHVGRLHHMTGGKASMPAVFGMEMTGRTPGFVDQHSDYEIELTYMQIPGVHTINPSTSYDANGMMVSALRRPDPVVFLDPAGPMMLLEEVPDEQPEVPLEKAVVWQEGTDLASAGSGGGMPDVLEAASGCRTRAVWSR